MADMPVEDALVAIKAGKRMARRSNGAKAYALYEPERRNIAFIIPNWDGPDHVFCANPNDMLATDWYDLDEVVAAPTPELPLTP